LIDRLPATHVDCDYGTQSERNTLLMSAVCVKIVMILICSQSKKRLESVDAWNALLQPSTTVSCHAFVNELKQ